MKPLYLITTGLLTALLAGGAAAQFNPDALKKMQKEGHKMLEEQQGAAADAAQQPADGSPAAAPAKATVAYRSGANLCLDARGGPAARNCNSAAPTQQWSFDATGRLVASDGRCLDGAALVACAAGDTQKWVHDKRGRLRNQAQQCLQPRVANAGAPVITAVCSGAEAQVWVAVTTGG